MNLDWVTDILRDLIRLRREGLVMEVRLRHKFADPVMVTVIDDFLPREFEDFRRRFGNGSFCGRIEQHWKNGAISGVRVATSLTAEDYRKAGGYRPVAH